MNSVQLTGRLTAEPQYMDKGQSDITHFTMAVQRSYKNKDGEYDADFIRCTAFGKRASVIADNFHKGSWIEVAGEWRTGSYQDKNGNTVYTNECAVNNFGFGGGNKKENSSKPTSNSNADLDSLEKNEPPINDNDMPF